MKKNNWLLGISLSAGISIIGSFPRLLRYDTIMWNVVATSFAYNFFFAICCWFIHGGLINRAALRKDKASRIWIGFGAITALGLCGYHYDLLFAEILGYPMQLASKTRGKRPLIVLIRSFVMSGFIYFLRYYLYVLAEKQKADIELGQLKQAQLEANLSSLKEQLSPHFLFNTLNTLTSLTQEKPVKDFVNELSNVYRYVLQYKERNTVTLQQELAFSVSYLYIIKTRLEEAINITTTVPDDMLQSKIPPLTLQLLIENAIKHNVAARYKPLNIVIYTANNMLVVENNFQPKNSSSTEATGTGLSNIVQRYRLLFDKEILIEQSPDVFTVKLPVV